MTESSKNAHFSWKLYLFAPWEIFPAFLSSADFFQNQLFRKILSGIPSECQTVCIQTRPDILLGQRWVQTVCKSYQQMTLDLVAKELIIYFLQKLGRKFPV